MFFAKLVASRVSGNGEVLDRRTLTLACLWLSLSVIQKVCSLGQLAGFFQASPA